MTSLAYATADCEVVRDRRFRDQHETRRGKGTPRHAAKELQRRQRFLSLHADLSDSPRQRTVPAR